MHTGWVRGQGENGTLPTAMPLTIGGQRTAGDKRSRLDYTGSPHGRTGTRGTGNSSREQEPGH